MSRELSVDHKLVEAVYKSYWKFIKEKAGSLQLTEMSEEDLDFEDTNFNIPYIGKLYVGYNKIRKYHNQLNYYQNVKAKKDKTNRKSDTCN